VSSAHGLGQQAGQRKKLHATDRDGALRLAAAEIQQATSGRDRFLRRLELAEACAADKDAPLARSLLTGLVADFDTSASTSGGPALAARASSPSPSRSPPTLPPTNPPATPASPASPASTPSPPPLSRADPPETPRARAFVTAPTLARPPAPR